MKTANYKIVDKLNELSSQTNFNNEFPNGNRIIIYYPRANIFCQDFWRSKIYLSRNIAISYPHVFPVFFIFRNTPLSTMSIINFSNLTR